MPKELPKEDVRLINDALKNGVTGQSIIKNNQGQVIASGSKLVNEKGFSLVDFRGRVVKHDKYLIPKGGVQTLIAAKGQKFDDIPQAKREQIHWFESDFE